MPQYDLTINVIGKDKSSGIFQGLSSGLESIFRIAGGIVAARVFMALADQIGDVVRNAINATAQFQNMQIGLEGLVARELSALTDGAKTIAEVFPDAQVKAAGLMEELSKLAIVSPYMVDTVIQTFRMQMAFGFTTDQAKQMTSGLLNMAAGIGATTPMLQRMAYNLAQINLQGKVTALDIRQLALAGLGLMDVLKYVAKQMGHNIETHLDFNELIAEGAITWEDFARLFEKYAEENFAGAAERMARTLVGLKSTFHDVFVLTMPKLLGPAAETVTKALNKVLDLFIYFRESGVLEYWGNILNEKVTELLGPFNEFMDIITKFLKIQSLLKDGTKRSATELANLRGELKKLSPTGDIVYDALYKTFGPKAAEWYDRIRKALGKLIEGFQWFRDVAGKVWSSVGILLEGLGKFWDRYGSRISAAIGRIVEALFGFANPKIQEGLSGIEGFATRIAEWLEGAGGERIAGGLENFADWLVETGIPKAREFVEWLEEKIPAAMETLSNFYYETLKPAWEDFKETWDENIMPGFQNLKQFWDENGDAILEVLGNFALALLGITTENANENIRGLGQAFEEGTKRMLEDGPQIVDNLDNITTKISNLVDTLTSPEFLSGAAEWAKFIGTLWIAATIINTLASLVSLFSWLGPLLLGVGSGASVVATNIVRIARWAAPAAAGLGAIGLALPAIIIGVIALGLLLQPEFDKITEKFTTWMEGLIADVVQWGKDYPAAYAEGAESERENLLTSMEGLATAALDLWRTTLSGLVFYAIGQGSLQGFWDGLKAKWAEIWAWTIQVLADWWALVSKVTFTRSPSTKAKEIGMNIMEGFKQGLEAGVPEIDRLLSNFEITGTVSKPLIYETVTIPVQIGQIASDVDIEELWLRLAERQRYERAMRRR